MKYLYQWILLNLNIINIQGVESNKYFEYETVQNIVDHPQLQQSFNATTYFYYNIILIFDYLIDNLEKEKKNLFRPGFDKFSDFIVFKNRFKSFPITSNFILMEKFLIPILIYFLFTRENAVLIKKVIDTNGPQLYYYLNVENYLNFENYKKFFFTYKHKSISFFQKIYGKIPKVHPMVNVTLSQVLIIEYSLFPMVMIFNLWFFVFCNIFIKFKMNNIFDGNFY